MSLRKIYVVARKELTDSFRDKRALYGLVFGTLFGPIFIGFMLTQQAKEQRSAQEIKVPVVGRENSPLLVHWLEQQPGVEVVNGPANPEQAIRDEKEAFVLVIEKEFAQNFREIHPAPVQLLSDSSKMSSQAKVKRIRALLAGFNGEMGSLRLVARGVKPTVASVLKVEDVEISTAQQQVARILFFIPFLLVMVSVTAGMQIATDSTAGERERLSLEPLLINPVQRWQLVGGKWVAAVIATLGGMAATLVFTAYILTRLPLEDLGVRLPLALPEYLLLYAAMAPMALLAPAIEIYLSCFAKSFKEAQLYISFMMMAAITPSLLPLFYPLDKTWMKPIPFLGQSLLANDVLGGIVPPVWMLVAAGVAALLLAAVFLWLATRLFYSEKIIFGR